MAATAAAHSSKRLAIVAETAGAVLGACTHLIGEAVHGRHKVLVIVSEAETRDALRLAELGAECRVLDLKPPGLRFFADRKALAGLAGIFEDLEPHTVMGLGGRAMVLAALAAKRAGTRRIVNVIDGVPAAGAASDGGVTERGLSRAMKVCDWAIFYNRDDLETYEAKGLVPRELEATVLPGAGVDLEGHPALPLPDLGAGLVFLMLAPLETQRGIEDYVAAARQLKDSAPAARFLLGGTTGRGAGAMSEDSVKSEAAIEFIGPVQAASEMARAHVLVYPSHAEGMPQPVLEALAAGRPVITTNTPGCRDTVDERVNGCLVPAGNPEALAAAMASFLKRPDLIPAMARASRSKAERNFDQRAVTRATLGILGLT